MRRRPAVAFGLLFCGLVAFEPLPAASAQAEAGWVTLLDGSRMNDWDRIGDANWRMEDGAAVADKKSGEGNSFLVSKNSYKDFQLRVEFWVDTAANSGIFIRCTDPRNITTATAYEVNIFDTRADPSYGTGAIVNVAKVDPMPKAGGRWNTFEITAKGSQLTVVLNGTKTVDVQEAKLPSGAIALQYGAGVVKFRKVQVRPL